MKGRTGNPDVSHSRLLYFDNHIPKLYLRVLTDLLYVVDQGARNPLLFEDVDPLSGCPFPQFGRQYCGEFVAIFCSQRVCEEPAVLSEVGSVYHSAETGP